MGTLHNMTAIAPPPPAASPYINRAKLMERWHIKSVITLRRWERAGKLHPVRMSAKAIFYRMEEIHALEEQAQSKL